MYVKIRSWHILRTWTRVPDIALTLCGKRAHGPATEIFGTEKTCETCLRLQAKTFG